MFDHCVCVCVFMCFFFLSCFPLVLLRVQWRVLCFFYDSKTRATLIMTLGISILAAIKATVRKVKSNSLEPCLLPIYCLFSVPCPTNNKNTNLVRHLHEALADRWRLICLRASIELRNQWAFKRWPDVCHHKIKSILDAEDTAICCYCCC